MPELLGQIYAGRRLKHRFQSGKLVAQYLVKLILLSFVSTRFAAYFFQTVSDCGVLILLFFFFSILLLLLRSVGMLRTPFVQNALFPFGLTRPQRESLAFYSLLYESGLMLISTLVTLFFSSLLFRVAWKASFIAGAAALTACVLMMVCFHLGIRWNWFRPKKEKVHTPVIQKPVAARMPRFNATMAVINRLIWFAPLAERMLLIMSLKSMLRKNPIYLAVFIATPIFLAIGLFSAPVSFFPVFMIASALLPLLMAAGFNEETFSLPIWRSAFPTSEKQHRHARLLLILILSLPGFIIGAVYALLSRILFLASFWHSIGAFLILIAVASGISSRYRNHSFIASIWSMVLVTGLGFTFLFPFLAFPLFGIGMILIFIRLVQTAKGSV